MILDRIDKLADYVEVKKNFSKIIEFLNNNDLKSLAIGRYELGNDCYVNVIEYEPSESEVFEAHRKYIDVQYIISGNEYIKWQQLDEIAVTQDYVLEDDCLLGTSKKAVLLDMQENCFAVFYPQDAHCPDNFNTAKKIKKAIFKITI